MARKPTPRDWMPDGVAMPSNGPSPRLVAAGVISVLAVILFVLFAFSGFGLARMDAGHVGVVRNGGPFDDRNIRQVLQPAQSITWTGWLSEDPRSIPGNPSRQAKARWKIIMACIRKRRGKWVADFRDGAGIRHWKTCETKRAAEDYLAKAIPETRQWSQSAVDSGITLEKYAERWFGLIRSTSRDGPISATRNCGGFM